MTNDRPEEHPHAIDGAGEDTDFHHSNAGKNKTDVDQWRVQPISHLARAR